MFDLSRGWKNQDTGNYQDVWNIKMLDNAYIKISNGNIDFFISCENIRYFGNPAN